MACNDETTVLEQRVASGINSDSTSLRSDETNLYKHIDRDKIFGLNLSQPQEGSKCIKPWDRRDDMSTWTESGVDDQFIITIPFTVSVKVKSILLNPGRGDFAPQRVRAFVNRVNGLDFEEVEAASSSSTSSSSASTSTPSTGTVSSGKAQADFLLQDGAVGVTEYPVSISRFQNVNSITLVISDAPSGSLSRLYYLGFRGTALNIKKEEQPNFQVGAANSADRPVDGVTDRHRFSANNEAAR